jgi:microcystin-dependent protein
MTIAYPASTPDTMFPQSPLYTAPLPPGSIIAFAGDIGPPVTSPPSAADYTTDPVSGGAMTNNIEAWGWMVCDGRLLYCAAYPQLFRTIGFLYSHNNDPYPPGYQGTLPANAEFRIPDYRGYFLRGVAGNAQDTNSNPVDPDVSLRLLTDGTANSGVGSIQQDALQMHWHEYTMAEAAPTTIADEGPTATLTTTTADTSPPTNTPSPPGTAQNTVRTSAETRSKNFYVHYLIKYV